MPVVLVHGVPETAGLWGPLRALEGAGHLWMLQRPVAAAAVLEEFWTTP